MSKHQVIWVATHDSIGLGEDGPTHQPVETAIHFRAMPNLDFWRPADGNETSAAYYSALTRTQTPSILSLSRQNLPNLETSSIEKAARGGYVVHEVAGEDLTIVSAGSEVSIALEAASKLAGEGIKTRIKQHLLDTCNLHTIVRLPNGVFNPYTGIKTNLLFFKKGIPTQEIWYYEHPYPAGYKS